MSGPRHDLDPLASRLVDLERGSQAARLLSSVPEPRPLSAEALARIHQRAVEEPARFLPRRPRLRYLAYASLAIAGAAGAGTVAQRIIVRLTEPVDIAPSSDALKSRGAAAGKAVRGPARPQIEPLLPVAAPPPAEPVEPPPPANRELRRPERARPQAKAAPPPEAHEAPAPVSALAEESALLEGALRKLRRERDGAGALRVLDEYRARFPNGELAHEAERTRVEALLLERRTQPALQVLDAMTFGSSARDLELVVVRGELRAQAGRCVEAEADFSAALARGRSGLAIERALYGRASCRSRRGDSAAARADLTDYLARYPNGKLAAEAKRALGK